MPIQKFIAVTRANQWRCVECGFNLEPEYYCTHEAVVGRSGLAVRRGPVLCPPNTIDTSAYIHDTSPKIMPMSERYTCPGCRQPYKGAPLEGSVTEVVHKAAGVETMEIDVPEDTYVRFFIPGQDGVLYGQGFYLDAPNFRASDKLRLHKRSMDPVRDKEGLIIWRKSPYIEGPYIALPNRLPAEVVAALNSVFLESDQDFDGPKVMFQGGDMVVWAREDCVDLAYYFRKVCTDRLMALFHKEQWWTCSSVAEWNLLT